MTVTSVQLVPASLPFGKQAHRRASALSRWRWPGKKIPTRCFNVDPTVGNWLNTITNLCKFIYANVIFRLAAVCRRCLGAGQHHNNLWCPKGTPGDAKCATEYPGSGQITRRSGKQNVLNLSFTYLYSPDDSIVLWMMVYVGTPGEWKCISDENLTVCNCLQSSVYYIYSSLFSSFIGFIVNRRYICTFQWCMRFEILTSANKNNSFRKQWTVVEIIYVH